MSDPVQDVVDHLRKCARVDAAIVVDGNADPVIAELLAAGWTWEGRPAEQVGGKRIRYLTPPKE